MQSTNWTACAAFSKTRRHRLRPHPRLVPILPDEVVVTRRFWLCSRDDLRKLRRITSLWDYLRAAADANRPLLMGESPEMHYVEP